MNKQKVFSSIDEKEKGVKLMQKWAEKSYYESYSKSIIKRALIIDWVKRRTKRKISITKEWLVYLIEMG